MVSYQIILEDVINKSLEEVWVRNIILWFPFLSFAVSKCNNTEWDFGSFEKRELKYVWREWLSGMKCS